MEKQYNSPFVLSHDVNYLVFDCLDIMDLLNLFLTCKTLKYDVEKYSVNIKKQIFRKLLNYYKCINCPSISYSISNICDNCIMDTCWECYNKSGSEFLSSCNTVDNNYLILKCIDDCKYKCCNCNFFYKKNYIKKYEDKYKIICIFCKKN